MRYRYVFSYESDSQPVETVRGELEAEDPKSATVRAARAANTRRPKGRQFRSWVIVVERLDVAEATQAADEAACVVRSTTVSLCFLPGSPTACGR